MNKPNNIYIEDETTTTSSTTRRFNYEKPEGWDGKKPRPKDIKLSKFQIFKRGFFNEEMDAKEYARYDSWIHEFKIVFYTVAITFTITILVFNSPFIETSSANASKDKGWLNRQIDYFVNKYDEWRGIRDIPSDTIYQVRKDTVIVPANDKSVELELEQLMLRYRIDSTRIADSLNNVK